MAWKEEWKKHAFKFPYFADPTGFYQRSRNVVAITLLAFIEDIPSINGDSPKTRDEQDCHIKIEIEQRKMESAERLMKKSRLSSKISRNQKVS